MAEILISDAFGAAMKKCIGHYAIRKILEIGGFEGDGSTQVLASSLATKRGDKVLVSLEDKPERFTKLVANTKNYPFIRPVQASSLSWDSFSARDFKKDVWESPFNGLRYPEKVVAEWHDEDLKQIKQIPRGYLEDSTEQWDAVLIDGGEFFGWDEFRILRTRSRCFFLDDAFHAFKCYRARVELSHDPDWRLLWADSRLRNGAAIYVHRTLSREGSPFSVVAFLHKILERKS